LLYADHEAEVQTNVTAKDDVRRMAGISGGGMTQYITRVHKFFNVDKLRQIGYAHQHCCAHGIYQEILGTICALLSGLSWTFQPACSMQFINECIESMQWSYMDRKESLTPITEDMVTAATKKGLDTTRLKIHTRNSQQSVLYITLVSAALNFYCDGVLPKAIEEDPTRESDTAVQVVRACRDLATLVRLSATLHVCAALVACVPVSAYIRGIIFVCMHGYAGLLFMQ
jgi:hypothetical protein